MDLTEWPKSFFGFFEFAERKECHRPAEIILSNALRCSEVRKERKKRPFSLSSRREAGRRPENRGSALCEFQREKPDGQQ